MALREALVRAFGPSRVQEHARLAALTTFRIGGPADWLVEVGSVDEIVMALGLARDAGVPVTVLGGGSNVLVSDDGVRGLVIRLRGGRIDECGLGAVGADAGVTLNRLVRWSIARGCAGLASWAGTPGTVGGAIHGNAHWSERAIGDFVRDVQLVTRDGAVSEVPREAMEFGYERSRPRRTGEVVLRVVFALEPGAEPAVLRALARASLARRKATQPLNLPSAGCVFQNPDPRTASLPPDVPASAGALIDRAGLKGLAIGHARVSTVHANFIVNEGGATARDVRALVELCRRVVRERFGVTLEDEIVCLGSFGEG